MTEPMVTEPVVAEEAAPRRPRGIRRDLAWIIGYFVVAGAVCGVLWWLVVSPPYFVRTGTGALMDEAQLGRRIQADGWFMVIGVAAGTVGGVWLTLARTRDPLLTLLAGSVMSLAGGVLALELGRLLGASDVTALARSAAQGTSIPDSLDVISRMVLASWPIGFLVGSVAILWGTHVHRADAPAQD